MTCLLFLLHIVIILHLGVCQYPDGETNNIIHSSSLGNLGKLLKIENELLKNLNIYAKQMQKKLNMIKLYQEMLHRSAMKSVAAQEEYVANPLNAFSLLRRLQEDWPKWLEYLQGGVTQTAMEKMQDLLKNQAAREKVLLQATEGLLHIEQIYDLETSHMAKGLLLNKQFDSSLDSADCFALGNHLLNNSKYYRANHWFRNALRLYQKPYIQLYSQVLKLKRNKLNRSYAIAMSKGTKTLHKRPTDATEVKWKKEAEKLVDDAMKKAKNEDIKALVDQYLVGEEEIFISERARNKAKPKAMEKGCQGLWPTRNPQRLTCRLAQDHSDFLRLAPLKLETLNEEPLIVLFHEVLSQKEIEHLKKVAISQGVEQDDSSTAQLFKLQNPSDTVQLRLSHKLSNLIQSNRIDHTMHLFHLGLGGHLATQSKSKPKSKSKTNHTTRNPIQEPNPKNRFGTVTIFINNVVLGGATLFPKLQLTVQPKQGNALIWYNQNKEGRTDKLAEHAVCPVVIGSRWVISNCFDEQRNLLSNGCLA